MNASGFHRAPVRWAWRPHRPQRRAEDEARPWLAAAVGVAPEALALARDARNRPCLQGAQARFDCNWSHSGEHLLLALGDGVRVGADVERVRERPRALALAERYFGADEAAWLCAQPEAARPLAFARLWCLKEAVLKAHGHGLAFGLDRVAFALDPSPAIVRLDPALGEAGDWRVRLIDAPPGYAAALAWRRREA